MKKSLLAFLFLSLLVSCGGKEDPVPSPESEAGQVFILNEGCWGNNNASLSVYDPKNRQITNNLFSETNHKPLGDAGNDIIVTKDYIIVALGSSNIIQFCDHDGKAVAEIEAVPSNRKMVADPSGKFLYVSSYANDGSVYKIDLSSFQVKGIAKVGYEPEGIVWYDGQLFVANSGGYAFQGGHDYEDSISIVDPENMVEKRRISTGHINLYGSFLQSEKYPQYILVNSSGDYQEIPASSFIFDCKSCKIKEEFSFPATYTAQHDGNYYILGSSFNYESSQYEYISSSIRMNPDGRASLEEWTIRGLGELTAPCGIFMTSEGELMVGDAADYQSRGSIFHFDHNGELVARETAGVSPAHFVELK